MGRFTPEPPPEPNRPSHRSRRRRDRSSPSRREVHSQATPRRCEPREPTEHGLGRRLGQIHREPLHDEHRRRTGRETRRHQGLVHLIDAQVNRHEDDAGRPRPALLVDLGGRMVELEEPHRRPSQPHRPRVIASPDDHDLTHTLVESTRHCPIEEHRPGSQKRERRAAAIPSQRPPSQQPHQQPAPRRQPTLAHASSITPALSRCALATVTACAEAEARVTRIAQSPPPSQSHDPCRTGRRQTTPAGDRHGWRTRFPTERRRTTRGSDGTPRPREAGSSDQLGPVTRADLTATALTTHYRDDVSR